MKYPCSEVSVCCLECVFRNRHIPSRTDRYKHPTTTISCDKDVAFFLSKSLWMASPQNSPATCKIFSRRHLDIQKKWLADSATSASVYRHTAAWGRHKTSTKSEPNHRGSTWRTVMTRCNKKTTLYIYKKSWDTDVIVWLSVWWCWMILGINIHRPSWSQVESYVCVKIRKINFWSTSDSKLKNDGNTILEQNYRHPLQQQQLNLPQSQITVNSQQHSWQ